MEDLAERERLKKQFKKELYRWIFFTGFVLLLWAYNLYDYIVNGNPVGGRGVTFTVLSIPIWLLYTSYLIFTWIKDIRSKN